MDGSVTIITLGDTRVGKSALMMAATTDDFSHEYIPTHMDQCNHHHHSNIVSTVTHDRLIDYRCT
jgi:GTPase SAR1 family protein